MSPLIRSTTVVIVARNRAAALERTLGELAALPERPPVVVVDNASDEPLADTLDGVAPRVTFLRAGRNLGAAARNIGAAAAETPYVAFADDDSWWAPGSLAAAERLFDRTPRLGLLAARTLVGDEQRPDPATDLMRTSPLGRPSGDPLGVAVLGFLACGAIVRRTAFLGVGGFHRRFGVGGEESLLAIDLAAAGWELRYRDDLVAHHHPDAGRDPTARRVTMVRNALWTVWLRRRAPLQRTLLALRHAATDPIARAGVAAALRDSAWIPGERRPVPASLELDLRLLDRQRGSVLPA